MEEKYYVLNEQTKNLIINYLAERPYKEVGMAIPVLLKMMTLEEYVEFKKLEQLPQPQKSG